MPILWDADEIAQLKPALKNVLWMGGGTDAGKTTTAKLLGEKYDLPVYLGDFDGKHHWENVDPDTQPAMHTWITRDSEQRWLKITVEELIDITLGIIHERLPLLIEDLTKLSKDSKVIVEWYGFSPNMIVPLLAHPNQAVWMFPSPEFKQASITRRNKTQYHRDTTNPEKAWANHLERDLRMSQLAQNQAIEHQQAIIINDGHLTPEKLLIKIEDHFGDLLTTP